MKKMLMLVLMVLVVSTSAMAYTEYIYPVVDQYSVYGTGTRDMQTSEVLTNKKIVLSESDINSFLYNDGDYFEINKRNNRLQLEFSDIGESFTQVNDFDCYFTYVEDPLLYCSMYRFYPDVAAVVSSIGSGCLPDSYGAYTTAKIEDLHLDRDFIVGGVNGLHLEMLIGYGSKQPSLFIDAIYCEVDVS